MFFGSDKFTVLRISKACPSTSQLRITVSPCKNKDNMRARCQKEKYSFFHQNIRIPSSLEAATFLLKIKKCCDAGVSLY